MNAIALLLGLIVVPGILSWLGHRLRQRSTRARGVFWGAVTGYGVAMVAFFVAALGPPLLWGDGSLRHAVVYWGLLAGSAAGAAVGAFGRADRA